MRPRSPEAPQLTAPARRQVLSDSACALYISLRYHLLHPDYLLRRLRELGPVPFALRLVLLLVDSPEAERPAA